MRSARTSLGYLILKVHLPCLRSPVNPTDKLGYLERANQHWEIKDIMKQQNMLMERAHRQLDHIDEQNQLLVRSADRQGEYLAQIDTHILHKSGNQLITEQKIRKSLTGSPPHHLTMTIPES